MFLFFMKSTVAGKKNNTKMSIEVASLSQSQLPRWQGSRPRTRVRQLREIATPSLKENSLENSGKRDSDQEEDGRKFATSTSEQPHTDTTPRKPAGYFSHQQIAIRSARTYMREGLVANEKEAMERAWEDIRKKKRIEASRRRKRMKLSGTKRKNYYVPGRSTKESIIGSKTARILGEKNHIVRYAEARKLAEEEYTKKRENNAANQRLRREGKKKVQQEKVGS